MNKIILLALISLVNGPSFLALAQPAPIQGGMDDDAPKKYNFQAQVKNMPTQKTMVAMISGDTSEEVMNSFSETAIRIRKYLESKGQPPIGRPFFRSRDMSGSTGKLGGAVGWVVKQTVPSFKDIVPGELPGGKIVYIPSSGVPPELRKANNPIKTNLALQQWLKDKHYFPVDLPWLVAISKPGTPPDQLKLDTYVPIR
jgi:hypothetical protein